MNLNDTLHGYDESLAKVPSDMPGEIGAVINGKNRTNVIGRGGFVYVRLRTNLSEPIQAYNDKVFPGFGIAVIVRWTNNRYEIIGRDSLRYQEWEADTPELAKHGNLHSLDIEGGRVGTDPAWIYPYQFMPGLVSPYNQSGAQNVYVHPFPLLYGGEWLYVGNTGTPSLTTYSPTSGTVLVLIAMDAETGNPALFATTGSYITWNISGSNSLVPNLPYVDSVRYAPLSFVVLQSGTTSISWENLRDLRQWISTSQSGTGGSGASLAFQDEGVPLGIPGTVNFVGENVSVTLSGTVARVYVTGSSGGVSDHNSLSGLQGGTGSQYYHLSQPEHLGLVGGLLTELHDHGAWNIVSGTFADDRVPGTPDTFCARLSLSSGSAVPTSDLVSQSTLYLHPYKGNRISLYDGAQWINHTLSSAISLSLTGLATASQCYDIFVYDNSGTLTLEAVVWTSATVRATALVYQDGVEVKASATTKRYVGTVYIDASKQATMEWDRVNSTTIARRHVWNRYNQVWTHVRHVSTASHTYTSATYRKWNNTDALTQEIVIGLLEQDVTCFAGGQVDDGANLDVAINWSSGGGELVDLRNDNAAIVSAFTGGGLRRNRIATEGLATIVVVEVGNGSAGTFGSGVLDVAYHS